ncbi:MAG: ABC transporter permease [Lachnospiraceae bacterium]|nr:ABC transporter permease [Lachnospiraceae bacterium]
MWSVFRRELQSYFITPIAYAYLAAVALLSGIYYTMLLLQGSVELGNEFSFMFTLTLLLSPLLTMRLLSEERRQRTDKLLISAPIRLAEIVLGKYFAACVIYLLGLLSVFLQAVALNGAATLNWAVIFANLLGLLLVGMACIAICLLMSAMTDNQIVAALGGFAAMIFVMILNTLSSVIPIEFIRTILNSLSFYNSYYSLTVGLLRLSDLWFFVTVSALFLFLTVQLLDRYVRLGR